MIEHILFIITIFTWLMPSLVLLPPPAVEHHKALPAGGGGPHGDQARQSVQSYAVLLNMSSLAYTWCRGNPLP